MQPFHKSSRSFTYLLAQRLAIGVVISNSARLEDRHLHAAVRSTSGPTEAL